MNASRRMITRGLDVHRHTRLETLVESFADTGTAIVRVTIATDSRGRTFPTYTGVYGVRVHPITGETSFGYTDFRDQNITDGTIERFKELDKKFGAMRDAIPALTEGMNL